MPRIVFPVIRGADGHTVLKKPPGDISPYQGRGGDIDLLCGCCHHVLAEHSYPGESEHIVLCCPVCGSTQDDRSMPTGIESGRGISGDRSRDPIAASEPDRLQESRNLPPPHKTRSRPGV